MICTQICIGSTSYKTDVVRRSLNPSWNCDWFCFEVFQLFILHFQLDDQALQEEVLVLKYFVKLTYSNLRVMDHDTYSSHDTIGRVYFDLNPLLCCKIGRSISGWFPIYDTMHGNIYIIYNMFDIIHRNKRRNKLIYPC